MKKFFAKAKSTYFWENVALFYIYIYKLFCCLFLASFVTFKLISSSFCSDLCMYVCICIYIVCVCLIYIVYVCVYIYIYSDLSHSVHICISVYISILIVSKYLTSLKFKKCVLMRASLLVPAFFSFFYSNKSALFRLVIFFARPHCKMIATKTDILTLKICRTHQL